MKRGYAFLAIVIFVLFFSACEEKKGTEKIAAFIGGVDGLEMSFVKDEPPKEVLDEEQESFFITVLLKNEGEFDIPEGGIIGTLSGINQDAFGLKHISYKSAFPLMGKQKEGDFVREGEQQEFDFGEAMYEEDLLADFSTKIVADVCYRYGTIGAGNLCLKKDVVQTNRRDICLTKNEDVPLESSAAPIQVISLRQQPSGTNAIRFIFTVENKGKGDVYQPNSVKDFCGDDELEDKEDEVYVTVTSPSSKIKPECSTLGDDDEGAIRLIDGKKQVICTIDTKNLQRTAYNDLIYMHLDYFYRDAISTPITVKNAIE